MKDFNTWLKENGLRTSLGPYPPLYGAGQYPPAALMPIAADAGWKLAVYHGGGEKTDVDMKPKKKGKKKGKAKSKKKD